MSSAALVVKALQIAEMRLGVEIVADKLGVTAKQVREWRMGRAPMPEAKFLLLVDVLTGADPDWDKPRTPT